MGWGWRSAVTWHARWAVSFAWRAFVDCYNRDDGHGFTQVYTEDVVIYPSDMADLGPRGDYAILAGWA